MTVVIGTAGHIDHGKTALLQALTGIDADRLPEEQRRGMTIDVGYAHLALADGTELDFVDVPGHDRLVGNMLVGAGEIDAALLVVAADDGIRAQTLEHLRLIDGLGLSAGLAVVTKADLVDSHRLGLVVRDVERMLGRTCLAGVPLLTVSSLTGEGVDPLREALVALRDRLAKAEDRHAGGWCRFAIDRAFAVRGRGTVVTGTLRGADLARNTVLRLFPEGRHVRVRGIQVHGRDLDTAGRGRVALNVAGVEVADLRRGMVLTSDLDVVATDRMIVALRRPPGLDDMPVSGDGRGWPPSDRSHVRLHIGTDQVGAVIGRSGRDVIELADGRLVAILRLERPIAAAVGDRFVLRRPSPGAPVAGGIVLDAQPAQGVSRRRQTGERVTALVEAIAAFAHAPTGRGRVSRARLDLHGALRGEGSGPVRLAEDVAAILSDAALSAVATHHAAHPAEAGMALARLRTDLTRVVRRAVSIDPASATAAAAIVVDRLLADGSMVREADLVRLPAHCPTPPDDALPGAMDRLEAALAVPGPPSLAEAARAAACPPNGIRALERARRIVVLEPDLAYASSTYAELTARALALAERAPLTPAVFRDDTGTSRKYVMAILEDLDRQGILRRTPAGHVPGPTAARGAPR